MSPVFSHGRLRLYLLVLLEESPRHGYEVIRLLEDRFMGLYAPSPGTVYPRLARLESEGLVTHVQKGGRKIYELTDAGRAEIEARRGELVQLEAEIHDSVRSLAEAVGEEVRGTAQDLKEELKQAARDIRRRQRFQEQPSWEAVRDEVRNTARDLKEELKQAARDIRDQQRSREHPCWEQAWQSRKNEWLESAPPAFRERFEQGLIQFEEHLDTFADQARHLVRQSGMEAGQIRECERVLEQAMDHIRTILHSRG